MANVSGFRIFSLDGELNSSSFEAVVAIGNWNNMVVSNKNGAATLTIRTDPDDETTEQDILVGNEFSVAVVLTEQQQRVRGSRFRDGAICCYLKVASGEGEGMCIVWA